MEKQRVPSPWSPAFLSNDKVTIDHDPDANSFTNVPDHCGFSKIFLPIPDSSPLLQRCSSDPSMIPMSTKVDDHHDELPMKQMPDHSFSGSQLNSFQSPPEKKKSPLSGSLQPMTTALRRTFSTPMPSPEKILSRSSSNGDKESSKEDTPEAKRLRRLKETIKKELNRLCDEFPLVDENAENEDEDVDEAQDHVDTYAIKEDCRAAVEEAVRVEKIGDCLGLHFNCPCGKGYQILLSGSNCYYKLM